MIPSFTRFCLWLSFTIVAGALPILMCIAVMTVWWIVDDLVLESEQRRAKEAPQKIKRGAQGPSHGL